MMEKWTHFNEDGKATMVDVGIKNPSERVAIAEGWVILTDSICELLEKGNPSKGNPFSIAEIAGIMAAKETSRLIPLCHQINLDQVTVECTYLKLNKAVKITSRARTHGVTGVEMEALTAVSVAALVFYDMCKGIDKGMQITGIKLLEKSGGKSGVWQYREEAQ